MSRLGCSVCSTVAGVKGVTMALRHGHMPKLVQCRHAGDISWNMREREALLSLGLPGSVGGIQAWSTGEPAWEAGPDKSTSSCGTFGLKVMGKSTQTGLTEKENLY